MQRGFLRGDASKNIETQIVGILDRDADSICRLSFSNNELEVSNPLFAKTYISLENIDEPVDTQRATIWSRSGEIHIKKPNAPSINLFEILTPFGYSNAGGHIHNKEAHLPTIGQGSIQFKKNESQFGATSRFQYNYGTNTLLVSKIAPFNSNAELEFQVHDNDNSLKSVLSFYRTVTRDETGYSGTGVTETEFECLFKDITINISNAPIRNCTFIGFDGTNNNDYRTPIDDARGCIYTSDSDGRFPFDSTGNIIIQPNNQGGCIIFPTASEQANWKNTVVIKDKYVSINPSRENDSEHFIEFDAQSHTRRLNIHAQEGDTGIWSLVHTTGQNLEFQYFESTTDEAPSQTLTMKRITRDNAFSYNDKHLCEYELGNINDDLFYKNIQNSPLFIHIHNNSSYSFSNDINNSTYIGTYSFENRELNFTFASVLNSISFYVPHSPNFQSIHNMIYENSHWVATSSQFYFTTLSNFINVSFDNDDSFIQHNLLVYGNNNNYTAYANSYSGFLASATGRFKNTVEEGDINMISFDDANPLVTKTNTYQDSAVVGVIGRIEKNDETINRTFFWGGFGTTIQDRSLPRVIISSTGFVGAWVVVNEDIDNTNNIEYNVGDLLTSHSCGALIHQTQNGYKDKAIYSYTIGKLVVDSVADVNADLQSENPSAIFIGTIMLELKGIMMLL